MDIQATFKKGFTQGLSLTLEMVKVIIPFYLLVEFMKYLGIIQLVADIFRPFMRIFGLPGEAALALIAGSLASLYAGIAVLTPLHLSPREITIIALILGISHSLTVETPITKRTGVNAFFMLFARISLGLIAGALLNLIWKLF